MTNPDTINEIAARITLLEVLVAMLVSRNPHVFEELREIESSDAGVQKAAQRMFDMAKNLQPTESRE